MSKVSTDGSIFNGVVADIAEINPRTDIALTEEEQVSFLPMQNTSESGDIISLQNRLLSEVSKGYTRFAENDVLVAKITPCFENGKGGFARGLLNGIGFGSTEFHVVRAMPGKADSKFLHHLTRSERFRRAGERSMTGSAGQKRIPAEFIKEFPIFVPPLSEQKKIAKILSGIDRKHSKLKGRINALSMIRIQLVREFLKQGMRKETDHANGLPQGWEERTLGEVSEFRRGSFPQPYRNPEWFDDAGYPFVQVYDIDDNGKLKPNTKNKISQAAADKSVFIPSGSLIVSLQGSIGRVAITQYDSYVDRTILIFTDYERILSREYFSLLVGDLFSRKGEVADGGVIKTITKQTLKEFSIRIPPLDEQQKLSEVVRAIDHSISLCKEQLFKVDLLRQSLAGDLLSGRKRVTV